MKVTDKDKVNIINAYNNELIPMITLADQYGMTRQGIYKILKQAGVDTSGRQLRVSCSACGNEMLRAKSHIRKRKHLFCSQECYTAYLNAGGKYIQNRHSSRLARELVSKHFDLQPTHIVHHEDKNQFNNTLSNLKVFRNQGDHIRYHRGFDVDTLWP